jgi:hypothetical protein
VICNFPMLEYELVEVGMVPTAMTMRVNFIITLSHVTRTLPDAPLQNRTLKSYLII